MTRTISLPCVAVAAVLMTVPAAAQDLEKELRQKTVMITVSFAEGQPEVGSGVLLCQQGDRAWVLTANHVFAGKTADGSWKQIRPRGITETKIEFFSKFPDPIVLEGTEVRSALAFSTFKPEDLLLVSFQLTQRLPQTASLARPAEGGQAEISTVGYLKDEQWRYETGELLTGRGSKFLFHSADVHEGFSGGPLFNDAGELIGINVERVPAEQTPGGQSGEWYGKALALDSGEILASIDKWVPARCLESATPMSDLAELTYRRAMREISIKRWEGAEELMRLATEQKGTEGGSVHLEGMRYTRYLPHYHLGLALFRQGKISEAIGEWERSEAQGEIQDDKRYRTMKRLRARAYSQLGSEKAPERADSPAVES